VRTQHRSTDARSSGGSGNSRGRRYERDVFGVFACDARVYFAGKLTELRAARISRPNAGAARDTPARALAISSRPCHYGRHRRPPLRSRSHRISGRSQGRPRSVRPMRWSCHYRIWCETCDRRGPAFPVVRRCRRGNEGAVATCPSDTSEPQLGRIGNRVELARDRDADECGSFIRRG
jgi:hypothetical protein